MTKSKFKKIIRWLFILYLGVVLFLHVMHADDFTELEEYFLGLRTDHWLHAIMFIPLGFLVHYVFVNRKILIGFTLFCCFFFETLQYFLPYRSFDITDIFSDITGTAIGLILYFFTHQQIARKITN